MSWILVLALGGAFVLVSIGLVVLNRRRSTTQTMLAESEMDGGIHVIDRMTAKFPALSRLHLKANDKNSSLGLGLQGNLAQTPLPDLLQYLSLGRKSGILELTSGRRTGRVILKAGRIAKHFYRGKEGLEAIFMMLELTEGDFEFSEQAIEGMDSEANLEVVDIIMLWMDRKPKKKSASK